MTKTELKTEYFNWMYQLVCGRKRKSYIQLLNRLHETPFYYIIEMDSNREADGMALCYRFSLSDPECDSEYIYRTLSKDGCSVLEMIIALAIRMEEHIMGDPELGDNPSRWFWIMLRNLGLAGMDDEHFDLNEVDLIIDAFLNRKYHRTGKGGLFHVKNCKSDLRQMEIWYQMCWYLSSIT